MKPSFSKVLKKQRILPALIASLFLSTTPVWAADYTVTNTHDSGPGSLRDALYAASDFDNVYLSDNLNGQTIYLSTPIVMGNKQVNVTMAGGTGSVSVQKAGNYSGPIGMVHLGSSNIQTYGGQMLIISIDGNLSQSVSGNTMSTSSGMADNIQIGGGGIFVVGGLNTLSGTINNNSATAINTLPVSIPNSTSASAIGGGAFVLAGINEMSGTVTNNTAYASSDVVDAQAQGGGIAAGAGGASNISIVTLSGDVTGNKAIAVSNEGQTYAAGGGVFAPSGIGYLSGTVNGNTIIATTSTTDPGKNSQVSGGGVAASEITILSGKVNNNTAQTSNGAGSAQAYGGGVYVENDMTLLSGTVSGNMAIATSSTNNAQTSGGGVFSWGTIATLSGTISNNTATATSQSGNAQAYGGGVSVEYNFNPSSVGNITTISGNIIGNTAIATAPAGFATAQGGGAFIDQPNTTITKGAYANNQAIAYGLDASSSVAQGGALFINTARNAASLTLNATDGTIIFANNQVATTGNSASYNDIYFGSQFGGPSGNASLNIETTDNSISLYGGVMVGMNNQDFTLNRDATGTGSFSWGGVNSLNSSGGNIIVNLNSGTTYLQPDFTLNGGSGNNSYTVNLGANSRLGLNFAGRNPNLAAFDFTNTGSPALNTVSGTTISTPRSFRDFSGHYLLISGLSGPVDISNFNLEQSPLFNLSLDNTTTAGSVYVDMAWVPSQYLNRISQPNARAAISSGALDQWLNYSDQGNNISEAQFNALLSDINSTTPEAIVTLGVSGLRLHGNTVNAALNNAFGGTNGMNNPAAQANANTFNQSRGYSDKYGMNGLSGYAQSLQKQQASLINNWTPADPTTRTRFMADQKQPYRMGYDEGANSASSPNKVWVAYLGNFDRTRSNDGYSGYNTDTNGILVGLTHKLNPEWDVGGYGGYTSSDTSFRDIHANANTDGIHLGLFGRYTAPNGLQVTIDAAYANLDNDVTRSPGGLSSHGSFKQDAYSLGLGFSYDLKPFEQGKVTPFLNFRNTWFKQGSYDEHGGLNAHVDSSTTNSFTSTLGASISKDFKTANKTIITPALSLAWQHEYGDRQFSSSTWFPTVTGNPIAYTVQSRPQERDTIQLGLSLDSVFKTTSGDLIGGKIAYGVGIREHSADHALFAGIEWKF